MLRKLATLSLGLFLASCGEAAEKPADLKPTDWLLSAQSDEDRFRLLQKQLRGFDQPMWEVGERFQRLHDALTRGNHELASYQWEKIRTTIENGIAKRPARAENAEALFLKPVWKDIDTEIRSGDPKRAWAAFDRAKTACQGCHAAEKVPYMNNQPLFELAAPSASAAAR